MMMPLSGMLTGKFGCRKVIGVFGFTMIVSLYLLAVAPSVAALACSLLLFGAMLGGSEVAMNVQSVQVQNAFPRPVISSCHGFFSLGGVLGAGGMSALFACGLSLNTAALAVVLFLALLMLLSVCGALPYGQKSQGPLWVRPRGIVLLIGILCFCVFLAEGAMLDWSGVFLIEQRGAPHSHAGWGYAAFSVTMTIGRLTGDRWVHTIGARAVVFVGAALGCAGYALAALLPWEWAGLAGFALVGVGLSNVVPVFYVMTGKQKEMPLSLAVASVSTIGYLGILAGPAIVGFVAQGTSLIFSFLLIALSLLAVALIARVKFR